MILHLIPLGITDPLGDDLILLSPCDSRDRLDALVAAAHTKPWIRPRDTVFGTLVTDESFRSRWDDIVVHLQ